MSGWEIGDLVSLRELIPRAANFSAALFLTIMITVSIGYPQALTVNTAFALPARKVSLHAMGPGAAGVGSNINFSEDGTIWTADQATPLSLDSVNAAFIRCNTGIATVIIKPV